MPAPRKVDLTELAALVEQGLTTPQLAEHFAVTPSTIARNRKRLGISTECPRMTPERRATIEAMIEDGMPFAEIHRTEGADPETLRRHFPGRAWTTEQRAAHLAALRTNHDWDGKHHPIRRAA
ncbi:helix-turn-helix DNA binding domain protein [Arthrobacter phage Vibaki]|uniref:Helix-turn-helix DNA binding domain protein n=1 Tax=Arthrobacter phage Vibaki TaxID=2593333 RepID=A0A514TYZ6_9CAUD|nr:DNA binding protein [Arthrobacter phage Vibaki]QDK01924.1 helix-turn-helix DNA binding domain protein [Arthrobacter phage Vibaki]